MPLVVRSQFKEELKVESIYPELPDVLFYVNLSKGAVLNTNEPAEVSDPETVFGYC